MRLLWNTAGGLLGDDMIHRADHVTDFTIINNQLLTDGRLSLEARGLMAYALALPDDWTFSIKGLAYQTGLTERAVMKIVKELKAAGYIQQSKTKDGTGKFNGYVWEISELSIYRSSAKPKCGKTELRQNRSAVKPKCGKTTVIQSTNNNQVLNITKEEKKPKRRGEFDDLLAPLDPVIRDAFLEFIKMRKTIKAPLTERALQLAIKKANDLGGGDPQKVKAVIEQSILNSWKGLFPLKDEKAAITRFEDDGKVDRALQIVLSRREGGNA